jgi:hypothetical protein
MGQTEMRVTFGRAGTLSGAWLIYDLAWEA